MVRKDSLQDVIDTLRDAVEVDARGLKRMKKRVFLTKLGYDRMTRQRIEAVDNSLRLARLVVTSSAGENHWAQLAPTATLTFAIDESDAPVSESKTIGPSLQNREQSTFQMNVMTDLSWLAPLADAPEENRRRSPESSTRQNPNIAVIRRRDGNHPEILFDHQKKAIRDINNFLNQRASDHPFAGLAVIPTGGGKTRMAVEWLLKHHVATGGKALWIAHRTELLN